MPQIPAHIHIHQPTNDPAVSPPLQPSRLVTENVLDIVERMDKGRWWKDKHYQPTVIKVPSGTAGAVDPDSLPRHLSPLHRLELAKRGLTSSIVEAAQITSYDSGMILPGFDRHMQVNSYDMTRPDTPAIDEEGKTRKYLAPCGLSIRAYFPPVTFSFDAINSFDKPFAITEGVLKALAAARALVPCIGLTGSWNWVVGGIRPYQLIPDLNELHWRGRTVLLIFDHDSRMKWGVRQSVAELARLLTELGAKVIILDLRRGARNPDGSYQKNAIDDEVATDPEWFHDMVFDAAYGRKTHAARVLEDWRLELERNRIDSLGTGTVNLDMTPLGGGKSTADRAAVNSLGNGEKFLALYPNHVQCRQAVTEFAEHGIMSTAYPQLTKEVCRNYEEATRVIHLGLAMQGAACLPCLHSKNCGWKREHKAASEARTAIATQKRGEYTMESIAEDRRYVSVHESSVVMNVPHIKVTKGFEAVALVADAAIKLLGEEDKWQTGYYSTMSAAARYCAEALANAKKNEYLQLPDRSTITPITPDAHLYRTMKYKGIYPPGEATRLVMMLANGQLETLSVLVTNKYAPDEEDAAENKVIKVVLGQGRVDFLPDATVWLNDATGNHEMVQATIKDRTVIDMTPEGVLPRMYPTVQIPEEVARSTSINVASSLLRGILYDLSQYSRFGLITHEPFIEPLMTGIGDKNRSRFAKTSHFYGSESRGSNAWYIGCDALIVFGTPRVPFHVIREFLFRIAKPWAAILTEEEADWGPDFWFGFSGSGKGVVVKTKHYSNHDWHDAYCAIVKAELMQAIGRARPILPNGIPVYIVSKEELGETLAEPWQFEPLTETQAEVLDLIDVHTGRSQARSIAHKLGCSIQYALQVLREIGESDRIVRAGPRSGWVKNRRDTK